MALTELLVEWRGWLIRTGAPVAPALRPGVEAGQIEAVLGPAVPRAVLDWFGWCDGVEHLPHQTIGDSWAVPGYWPVELGEVAKIKPIHDQSDDPLLADRWAPLLRAGGSDLYAAAWSPGMEPVVVSIMPECGPAEVEFDGIEQMVHVFNTCFSRSAFFLDADGHLDVVQALYDEIYESITGRTPV